MRQSLKVAVDSGAFASPETTVHDLFRNLLELVAGMHEAPSGAKEPGGLPRALEALLHQLAPGKAASDERPEKEAQASAPGPGEHEAHDGDEDDGVEASTAPVAPGTSTGTGQAAVDSGKGLQAVA
ncbi:MAG: hypothetical protein D6721_04165 [Gammaproteobacteria bacterium]|nr:MAG: hypothetical protein D6721_04165 [Gammaproteobacteria bacterium]